MSIANNTPDRSLSDDLRATPERSAPTVREHREPSRPEVEREKKSFFDRTIGRVWRNRWKIAVAGLGALVLYHFRFWMREKLHLAFSKVPQNEIEGNMGTTATAGAPRRALPGNSEGRGTDSSSSSGSSGF